MREPGFIDGLICTSSLMVVVYLSKKNIHEIDSGFLKIDTTAQSFVYCLNPGTAPVLYLFSFI